MAQAESFADLALRFRAYHSNSLNVVLHMLTTPMGLVAALIPLRQNCGLLAFAALVGAYAVSLAGPLKAHKALWVANTAWLAALATIALLLAGGVSRTSTQLNVASPPPPPPPTVTPPPPRVFLSIHPECKSRPIHPEASLALSLDRMRVSHRPSCRAPTFAMYDILKLAAAAYVGQEAAHLITGEKTFQSTYMGQRSWPSQLLVGLAEITIYFFEYQRSIEHRGTRVVWRAITNPIRPFQRTDRGRCCIRLPNHQHVDRPWRILRMLAESSTGIWNPRVLSDTAL